MMLSLHKHTLLSSSRPRCHRRAAGGRVTSVRVLAFKDEETVRLQEREHMLETVHYWFQALRMPDIPIDPLVSNSNPVMVNHLSEQKYVGMTSMKEGLQQLQAAMPAGSMTELENVVDVDHHSICAGWACKAPSQQDAVFGSYVFKFDPEGRIKEVAVHVDSSDKEYPEA